MPNHWEESRPNLTEHEFEIYNNVSGSMCMDHFHGHSFYEIRIIIYGNIIHYNENSKVTLRTGDVSIIPPGLFHRAMPALSPFDAYARVLLYVSTGFMHSLDSAALSFAEIFNQFGYEGKQHLHFSEDELGLYYKPLQEIVHANDDDKPLGHLINRARVTFVLAKLAERIGQSSGPVKQAQDAALVPRVIAYINANLSENLSLDELSERFFVSKFHLSHQFKEYAQLSLHQYILARRMMHAQILLRSGQSPMDVARACGYHEYSSFYKAFLRETGASPRAFE